MQVAEVLADLHFQHVLLATYHPAKKRQPDLKANWKLTQRRYESVDKVEDRD